MQEPHTIKDTLTLSGNGQRYCGDLLINPFNCDPRFVMSQTQAATPEDFNTFTFQEFDRVVDGDHCDQPFGFQQLFRQCQGQACDGSGGGGNGCNPPTPSDFGTVDDTVTSCDPIVLDLTGNGFDLTDTPDGVIFDIHANGHPVRIPWTMGGSDTAFLVLDLNGNGKIDDATELFSNVTPQPSGPGQTGFKALAQYDRAEAGGNGDGVINATDAIYSRLRLWIDVNHDGISQPEELRTLLEMGVSSISLDFQRIRRQDQYGNIFLFQANVNPDKKSGTGRKAYDVFFVTR